MGLNLLTDEELTQLTEAFDDVVTRAAYAVHMALSRYKGKRLKVDRYRVVVGQVYGMRKVYAARIAAVVTRGAELGLFSLDSDSGSYPFLVCLKSLQEAEEDRGVCTIVFDSTWPSNDRTPEPGARSLEPEPRQGLPEDWNPPEMMPCGHFENPCTPNGCQQPKVAPSYRDLQGKYRVPVPEHMRYSEEKVRSGGYPGLHCDDDGYYVGGTFNRPPGAN